MFINDENIDNFVYNHNLYRSISKIAKDNTFPNIIFFGKRGTGKYTTIKLFLEIIYGKDINILNDAKYTVNGSNNIPIDIIVKQSNYHIMIEPQKNNFDKYIIQEIIKEYARVMPLFSKPFKVVYIKNVDNLTYLSQMSLRRTMEKYISTCRFVMSCCSLSKIYEPLRSRSMCIFIKAPNQKELFQLILHKSEKHNVPLRIKDYSTIVTHAQKNPKKAIWLLEYYKYKIPFVDEYDICVNEIFDILKQKNYNDIQKIINILYKIFITDIDLTQVIIDVLKKIFICFPKLKLTSLQHVTHSAQKYQYRMINGRRDIVHLHGFFANVYKAI